MFKPEIHIYNHDGSFRYRMAVERIPVKGDLLQLDGFFYEVEKVLEARQRYPKSFTIPREFGFKFGRVYRTLEIVNAMRSIIPR